MLFFGYKTKTERIVRDVIFIALGVLFLFFPNSWFSGAAFLVGIRILGVILLLLGVLEVVVLLGAMAVGGVGLVPFLLAVGTVLFGFAMLFSEGDRNYLFVKLVSGLALLWYGITDLISGRKIDKAIDEYEIRRTKEAPKQTSPEEFTVSDPDAVKEVEYRKED